MEVWISHWWELYMESNSASNWFSFQCNLHCRIQTCVEFCWVTQQLQKQICSTLLCRIYCLDYFAKMLSAPQFYMELSNSASNWFSFQCNLHCRIQTCVEFCWVTQQLQKQICSTLLCRIYCLDYFAKMLSAPQFYMELSNSASNWFSFQCNLHCRIQTCVEFCWVTQQLQKQICSTLLCRIYCLDYFAKMLSAPQFYMESNSASNWFSFQCNLHCRIQTCVEFGWVTQQLQKQICSTLLCRIYCLDYFAKMLSAPQFYMESNSASNWFSFQCNLHCRIQTCVEFGWVTQQLQKQICSTLLCRIYCLDYFAKMLSAPQFYMESNSASNWFSFQCNLHCRIQTCVEFGWVTQQLQKQICSTLLCRIYCLDYFAKMLSAPQFYMESNSASNWFSFQCNLHCRIQTCVEFGWVTQQLQKQICSTLLCRIYCLDYFAKMLSAPQFYMESNSASNWFSFQCNLHCRIQTCVEFGWVTQQLQKQICSTLLCRIYCLDYFAKMLSAPQFYMESNSASNWFSFQCNLHCRIQTCVEFGWVTQQLQKQICSTLLCRIYCLDYFAKMLSAPQFYMESNSASNWFSFQCNLHCRIQTCVEFGWVTQQLQKQICSTLLCRKYCLDNRFCIVEWNKSAFGVVESLNQILRKSEFCNANCIGMKIN